MSIENGVIVNGSPIGGEVFTFFGVGKRSDGMYYWSDVLLSSTLNPKSKHKPMEYPYDDTENIGGILYSRTTRLSDNQKRRVNYGHTFNVYSSGLAAIRAVAGGTNFPYSRPSSWGRIADLWGYNHNATDWHEVTTSITSIGQGSNASVEVSNLEGIFALGALSGLNVNNVNFGFLMWNSAFSTSQPQVYFLSLTNMGAPNNEQTLGTLLAGGKLSFSTSNIPLGTWRMYPCVTTASFTKDSFNYIRTEEANGSWYPFPYSNTHIITVVSSGSGEENVIDSISVYDYGYEMQMIDAANLSFSISNLILAVYNEGSTGYTVSVQARIDNAIYNRQTFSGSVYVGAGQEAYISLIGAKSEEDYYRFSVADTPPRLWVRYYLTKDGQTQESQTTIDLDKY